MGNPHNTNCWEQCLLDQFMSACKIELCVPRKLSSPLLRVSAMRKGLGLRGWKRWLLDWWMLNTTFIHFCAFVTATLNSPLKATSQETKGPWPLHSNYYMRLRLLQLCQHPEFNSGNNSQQILRRHWSNPKTENFDRFVNGLLLLQQLPSSWR